jgi:Fe2+ or Zn2+ uptake regulation protein
MSMLRSRYFHCFRDGSHNTSICRNCGATVSSEKDEINLAETEDQHVCDREDIYFFLVGYLELLPSGP